MAGQRFGSDRTILWLVIGALVLVVGTRLPIVPSALSFDNVNLAFALEQFDPWMHQPQPPGYPFFVAEARLIDVFFHDAEKTFHLISVVVTWLSVIMVFLLGKQIFGMAAGITAALLITFNPTFWYSGLDSPLRPHLALFSLIVAFICWRIWKGETRLALWGALALGVGGGFRPDLVAYLFPLWCASLWTSRASWKTWIRGIGIIFAITIVWLGVAAYAVGGLDRFTLLMWVYSFSSMEAGSLLLSLREWSWTTSIVRMFAWNGLGVLSWAWLLPLWLFVRGRAEQPPSLPFMALWIGPGMLLQGILHVEAPGHTLFSVPAFCLVGGSVITATCSALSRKRSPVLQTAAAAFAVVLNVLFFFNILTLNFRSPEIAGRLGRVVTQAFVGGVQATTFADLRAMNVLAESAVQELKDLTVADRPVVVVSTHGSAQYFRFLNSRIASYYVADQDFWVVMDENDPPRASRIRGKDLLEIRYGNTVKIPIPRGGRIIWLMDPSSPFRDSVSKVVSLVQDGSVFHTDLGSDLSRFRVDNFEFTAED